MAAVQQQPLAVRLESFSPENEVTVLDASIVIGETLTYAQVAH